MILCKIQQINKNVFFILNTFESTLKIQKGEKNEEEKSKKTD